MRVTSVPVVTSEQMREIDRVAIEEFGLALLQMMENAGRGFATLAARKLRSVRGRRILCLTGKGGNGGGGLTASRHLANWGARVTVIAEDAPPGSAANLQGRILREAGVPIYRSGEGPQIHGDDFDVVLDAVLGYGLHGDPRGPAADLIHMANRGRLRLSLDVPSGFDATRGIPSRPCVRAHATLTLALPKVGLLAPRARPYVGELWLADLGIPRDVYARLGIKVPLLFPRGVLIRRLQ